MNHWFDVLASVNSVLKFNLLVLLKVYILLLVILNEPDEQFLLTR